MTREQAEAVIQFANPNGMVIIRNPGESVASNLDISLIENLDAAGYRFMVEVPPEFIFAKSKTDLTGLSGWEYVVAKLRGMVG